MPFRTIFLLVSFFVGMQPVMSNAALIEFNIAEIDSASFSARAISIMLSVDGSANLQIAEIQIAEKKWEKIHVHCTEFLLSSARVVCRDGKIDIAPDLPFTLEYEFAGKRLNVSLAGSGNELWHVHADFSSQDWSSKATFRNAQASRLASLIPQGSPIPASGLINGKLEVKGGKNGGMTVLADIELRDLSFSDSSGLHAGEKLHAKLNVSATHADKLWESQVLLDWQSGDLFWQPLFLQGGHSLLANINWDGSQLKLVQTSLNLEGVGKIDLEGVWDAEAGQILQADVVGNDLGLKRLFADYAKPFLGGGILADSEVSGTADIGWKYRQGKTQEFVAGLRDASIVDEKKRFSLIGINAEIPWGTEETSKAKLAYSAGTLWGVPLGTTLLEMHMRGMDFAIADATLPILDGKLSVHDFHLYHELDEWRWSFSGGLTPLSMPPLSAALGWPEMQGTLSGMIPQVSYQDKTLKVDGALLFRVFDGSVVVSSLNLFDPFGRAPRLYGNLDMRELDLGALTQAFSFGNVQGRIDVDVKELELVNWQPVHFDAKVESSPGSYRKKISQRAVQNISALGGAGAAAAVQRSVMSIFENFGYDRIVLSCVLRNGVCEMDGAEPGVNGGYCIVKGGGIPAINVMGYNHKVDWNVLLLRLKRVIKGNTKAVVQ